MLRFYELRNSQRGQAIVEMALVMPLLVMLLFGIVEFGRVLNTYIVVTNLSREGARIGAVGGTDTAIIDFIKNSALKSGFDTSQISISPTPTSITKRSRGSSIQVNVSYPVDIFAPVIGTIIGDPYVVECQTTMRVEG